ncbi:MAG TPA: sigma-70 family RNA polymerase sigma factor [Casimicrobiaceae bacterium]|nr:sigma-70 family RNA polymerase sigma factor [Casimicrobiaceae bacterium]
MELEEDLFRREAGRLVGIVTRLFGFHNLALAEDVVQDVFCRALETWKFHGVPQNPSAWLMTSAKHRALDILRRERTARNFAADMGPWLESEWTLAPTVDEAFDAAGITDVELRMMFSCIHPALPEETQIALVLNLLCGFSVEETAAAFLKKPGTTEKRLTRAKATLAESKELFNLGGAADVAARLPAVLRALYLLFNEGYHGASPEGSIQGKLCAEALRLARLLLQNRLTSTPAAHALVALFNFLAARLPGRRDAAGNLTLLIDQDRSRWDRTLIAEGRRQLELSATGDALTTYHVEAAIASLHADAERSENTDWNGIVALYDALMRLHPTPVVALNRAVALAERDGPERGLAEIDRIEDRERLSEYPFYLTAIAEFELRLGHKAKAQETFAAAIRLARNPDEQRFLQVRMNACREPRPGS